MQKFGALLYDISFADHNSGITCSLGGNNSVEGSPVYLFITNDGGETWTHCIDIGGRRRGWGGSCQWLRVKALEQGQSMIKNVFFVLGEGLHKSIDQGSTWTHLQFINVEDSIDFRFGANDFHFADEETGWVIGTGEKACQIGWGGWVCDSSSSCILNTKDGGQNWNITWKSATQEISGYSLNRMHITATTRWAVGEYGLIVNFSEPGSPQIFAEITDLPLNDVFFCDKNHGWITGGYSNDQGFQSILIKTVDAGRTWNKITFDKYLLNDMYFADSLHGWAVGTDTAGYWGNGVILETLDGGDNWFVQVEGLSAPLNAIHFNDGIGWAVGRNGFILRTDNWIAWIDQKTDEVYLKKYRLSQNYPNPFNPSTIIDYQLPITSNVELNIYNLLGQRVVTLVRERQQAGYYQIEWEASRYSSGVYYYRLKAGEFQDVKKMIILK
jgi:photosystem II stability/assembly factor-like uncharacterized protein